MKLLITGSTGFIGKNLCEFYEKKGHDVFRSQREPIEQSLEQFQPHVIINCAAEIYLAPVMFESNIILTQKCLEYVRRNRTTKMIQLGSSSEVGRLTRAGAETDPINPEHMYAATKGAATLLCQGYAREYKLDITIGRPYSVYGRYERLRRLFPVIRTSIEQGKLLKLSNGYHDWIYIDDFVRGIDWMIMKTNPPGEIFHFGKGTQESNYEVLDLFEHYMGSKANLERINQFHNYDTDMWVCDITKTKALGFVAEYSLSEGIKAYLEGSI